MPAAYLMSWEPTARRWWKMAAGRRFVVSVRQLRKHFGEPTIPETKEGSYPWANRWWQESSQLPTRSPKPEPTQLLEYGDTGFFFEVPQSEIDHRLARRAELRRGVEALLHPVEVPVDRSVRHQIQCYLDMLFQRHRAGEISVGEYANARAGLIHFRDWIGADAAIETITAQRWQEYYLHLIGPDGPKSTDTRRKHFRFARNFVTWMDDLGIQPAPPNLNRKQYRFKGGPRSVPTMSIELIKKTLDAAKGQLRLHLLLMLNCGFTQQDVSDLHSGEVEWEQGRIRRKRSKTGDHDKVPFVDYPLWSETFSLLKRHRSDDPDRVLLTESGKKWMRDAIHDDGSRSRTDAIQSCYRNLVVEGKQPLKMFRKASSTLIDGSSEHGRYAIHFLGHAPDVAHRHYINSNGAGFDAAVRWLGEQYGF